jgi:hypothetical protein
MPLPTMHSSCSTISPSTYKAVHKKLYSCFIDCLSLPKLMKLVLCPAINCGSDCKTWAFMVGSCMGSNRCMTWAPPYFSIKLDAGLLDPIAVTVGVKQGCPLL